MRNESTFCTEVLHSLRDAGAWAYKIPDMPIFKGMNYRFASKKPFDIVAVMDGRPIAIECKFLRGFQAFGLRHLAPHQQEALEAFEGACGLAYVFVNVYEPRKYNKLIILNWFWLMKWGTLSKKALSQYHDSVNGTKQRYDLSIFKYQALNGIRGELIGRHPHVGV